MREIRLGVPSPAFILAFVALCAAVGGSAYAGVQLGKGSVDPRSLRKQAVTARKLAPGAVTEPKIADGAVTNGKLAVDSVRNSNFAARGIATLVGGLSMAAGQCSLA